MKVEKVNFNMIVILACLLFSSLNSFAQIEYKIGDEVYVLDDTDQVLITNKLVDSIIYKEDSTIVYCSILDTVVYYTDILSYLSLEYISWGALRNNDVYEGILSERKKDTVNAMKYFQKAIYNFNHPGPPPEFGGGQRDGIIRETNKSILLSYAYEKLDSIDKAIEVLGKWTVLNSEQTKIHRRYIELCIKKFGKKEVKKEFLKVIKSPHITNLYKYREYDQLKVFSIFNGEFPFLGRKKTDYRKEKYFKYIFQ